MKRPVRVVLSKVGLDGHDRGVLVVARALRDAGMEVIYTGLRRTAEEIVQVAVDEDVDVIGLSTLSGAYLPFCKRVMQGLEANHMAEEVLVLVGGIIPPKGRQQLTEMGVDGVFGPGTPLSEIVRFIAEHPKIRRRLA